MRAEDVKERMLVRNRKVLAFGIVTKVEADSIVYVASDQFEKALAADLAPVAVIVPVLVQVTCPCCGEASNRKPFTGWIVEICLDCGKKYAAGPFLVGPPLEVVSDEIMKRWAGKPQPVFRYPPDSFEVNEARSDHEKTLSDWKLANPEGGEPC